MNLWSDLVKMAVIGAERQPFALPPSNDPLAAMIAQFDQKDREGALLGAAAAASLYERTGRSPLKETSPLPPPSAIDDTPRCSEKSALRLRMMLQGQHNVLLPEWLNALARKGGRVPEEFLPSLLLLGQATRELHLALLPVLGSRGRWLASQCTDWEYAMGGEEVESFWETAGRDRRFAILESVRKRDAARARELLVSTWEQESPKDRTDFL